MFPPKLIFTHFTSRPAGEPLQDVGRKSRLCTKIKFLRQIQWILTAGYQLQVGSGGCWEYSTCPSWRKWRTHKKRQSQKSPKKLEVGRSRVSGSHVFRIFS